MYDQVTKTDDTPTGEGNYCMLEESTFSNTYESVSADMYSEIKKPVVQVSRTVTALFLVLKHVFWVSYQSYFLSYGLHNMAYV